MGYSPYTRHMNPEPFIAPHDQPRTDGDASLIRWMLALSPEERLAVLQGFVDSAIELAAMAGDGQHLLLSPLRETTGDRE
jgi:hypothetical protein